MKIYHLGPLAIAEEPLQRFCDWIVVSGAIVALLAFVLNLYFALRFAGVALLSANLRLLVITHNALCVLLSVVHQPLQLLNPKPDAFSLAKGHYFVAFAFYGFQYYTRVMAYFFGCKYILIAIERHYALRHRATYEQYGVGFAVKLVIITIGGLSAFQLLWCVWVFRAMDGKLPLDQRLRDAIEFERQPLNYILLNFLMSVSAIGAGLDIWYLSVYVRKERRRCHSLTESFQIKQTADFLRTVRPLFLMNMIMGMLFNVPFAVTMYDYFWGERSVESLLYKTANNCEYWICANYVLISAGYLCWHYEPMRRVVAEDMRRLLGYEMFGADRRVHDVERGVETSAHFVYLKSMWE